MKKSFYEEVNPRSQVFAEEEFDVLMDDFVDLKRQGKPLVVRKKLMAFANEKAGLFEDREIDMIFVLNSHVQEFEDGLSDEAKRLSEHKSRSVFHRGTSSPIDKDFPYISSAIVDYSIEEVNKLSHLVIRQ